MVAKSLHGRVGVGCAATNIAMVNRGTPGIGLGGGERHVNVTPQDRMSLKCEHLEHHFRWGLSELGIVVAVMGGSKLENGPLLSPQLLGD